MSQTRSGFDNAATRNFIQFQQVPIGILPKIVKHSNRYVEQVYRVEGEYRPNALMRLLGAKPVEGKRVLVPGLTGRTTWTDCIIDFGDYVPALGEKFKDALCFDHPDLILGYYEYLGVMPVGKAEAPGNVYRCSVDAMEYTARSTRS